MDRIPTTARPYPRFAIRKVRDGKVRIRHRDYVPDDRWFEYDGRLEGMELAFGLYWYPLPDGRWQSKNFVFLWGTKEEYDSPTILRNSQAPYMVEVDGERILPWPFWDEEVPHD